MNRGRGVVALQQPGAASDEAFEGLLRGAVVEIGASGRRIVQRRIAVEQRDHDVGARTRLAGVHCLAQPSIAAATGDGSASTLPL